MSWQDRNYSQEGFSSSGRGWDGPGSSGGWLTGLPRPTPVVKMLLIASFAVFLIESLCGEAVTDFCRQWFALKTGAIVLTQPWTLITYQFLHADLWHIGGNMLGLYFLGPMLESMWRGRKFLAVYLMCGVVGGLTFLLVGTLYPMGKPIVGASGAVLGVVMMCAVLFPHVKLILLVFPVPIRAAVLLFVIIYVFTVLTSANLSDACHLGGMAAGYLYLRLQPTLRNYQTLVDQKRRQWKAANDAAIDSQIDEILAKVHRDGLHSLTRQERQVLADATERQRRQKKK